MEFAEQRNPSSNISGLVFVVALHAVLGYALLNGLAHKVVEVWNKPLGVSLIEEAKPLAPPPPPPPPPPQKIAPMPKVVSPPPAYVPPPEVATQAPPQQEVIAATVNTPAPPVEIAPPPTPVAEAPPPPKPAAPPAPAIVAVGVACPNHVDVRSSVVFPPQAQRMGLNGDVVVEVIVGETGQLSDIHIAKSSNAVFNDAALSAVGQLRCNGAGRAVRVRVPFAFRLDR